MNDQLDFETRLTKVFADYADRAPVEVDPVSMTAAVARRRSRLVWPTFTSRRSWLVIGATLALLALGTALVAGSYLLRSHTSIGGGGPMLINQADWPGGDATRQVTLHVFSLDEASGERAPIMDFPPVGRSYWLDSPVWAPDHTHALLTDGAGNVRIIDAASKWISPIQLKPTDTYISFADGNAWARGSDRVATQVSNDTTNIQGSILISDINGREVGRMPVPAGWSAGRPVWSPDGKSLILMGCQNPCVDGASDENLLLVPLDGSPIRVLLQPAVFVDPPVWSPDGTTIAFGSPAGIQTMDFATGRQGFVTHANDRQPAWSPDGRRIAFARLDAESTNGAIYVVAADGTNLQQLTSGNDSTPDWSPDGTMVVFGRRSTDLYPNVWVIGADGASPRLLIAHAVADW